MFFNFLYLGFDQNDIDGFVTAVKQHLSKLKEVGIDLPPDILSYLILFKLPDSLKSIRSQIMHSGVDLTVTLVLNHLVQHRNEVQSKNQDPTNISSALYHQNSSTTSLLRCENGKHNPLVKTHPPSSCWSEFPHLRPDHLPSKARQGFKKKEEAHFYSFFCALKLNCQINPNQFILDSGCSIHIFRDKSLFTKLNQNRKVWRRIDYSRVGDRKHHDSKQNHTVQKLCLGSRSNCQSHINGSTIEGRMQPSR